MYRRVLLAAAAAAFASASALAQSVKPAPKPSPEIVKELAPAGKLRAAINLGNSVLAQGTKEEPRGLSVDLAREVAKRTGLTLELITFDAAGKVFEANKTGAWDIAFMAREPQPSCRGRVHHALRADRRHLSGPEDLAIEER